MEASSSNVDSSFLKSWSPEVAGVTMGVDIFQMYIEKKIFENLLKNQSVSKAVTYV